LQPFWKYFDFATKMELQQKKHFKAIVNVQNPSKKQTIKDFFVAVPCGRSPFRCKPFKRQD
jgi:hypothetical protein